MALGFTLGTMLLPGVGSLIGSVVGGLAGGLAGDKYMLRSYQALEDKIDFVKLLKHPVHGPVSDDTFKEALTVLDSGENDELITIENRFFDKMHYVTEKLHEAKKEKDE